MGQYSLQVSFHGFIKQHSHHWKTKNLVPFPAHDDSWPAPQRPRIAYRNGESWWINGTVFVFGLSLGKAISADCSKNNCWLVVFRHLKNHGVLVTVGMINYSQYSQYDGKNHPFMFQSAPDCGFFQTISGWRLRSSWLGKSIRKGGFPSPGVTTGSSGESIGIPPSHEFKFQTTKKAPKKEK